ncbi:MAG: aminotransferase class V-fold PLP-dependent enzyme [Bacteroidota bacterium]
MNNSLRQQFPSLSRTHHGHSLIYMDGPGGTQVPQGVIDAVGHYYRHCNANAHGLFPTTIDTDRIVAEARQKVASLLGAAGPHTISFGQNMTTLCYQLSRAIGRYLQPGDEILITQLDHEANRSPWLALRESGIIVREINLLKSGTLDYDDFRQKINERTRLVAMGASSNIIGTVNDIALARQLTHQYGAWLLLDAVHYVPHYAIDVQAMDCDFLLCSAYKFYGKTG